jgi:hypothetical protein
MAAKKNTTDATPGKTHKVRKRKVAKTENPPTEASAPDALVRTEAAETPVDPPLAAEAKELAADSKRRPPEPEVRITRKPQTRDDSESEEMIEVSRVAKKTEAIRRKRPARRVNQELPTWAVWLISVGGFILVAGSIALGAILKGHGALVLIYRRAARRLPALAGR